MFEEAKSGALRALDAFEKFGAAIDVERTLEIFSNGSTGTLEETDLDPAVSDLMVVSSSKRCYMLCVNSSCSG